MTGYFDLQINGCFGVDFNADSLSQQDWMEACRRLNQSGTSHFLPTIITDSLPRMMKKIQRLVELSIESNSDLSGSWPIGRDSRGGAIYFQRKWLRRGASGKRSNRCRCRAGQANPGRGAGDGPVMTLALKEILAGRSLLF